jgi:tetratricopeptide (TPR) repeat protein
LKGAALLEALRLIREEEPPKPSTRLSTLEKAALSTVCECRGVEPGKLGQQVRGELDWIVMKALEKDRNRRYESASALAADVQRYLNDEPVAACPPSAGYRLRKFAWRYRRMLMMAGVIALVLVGATALSIWQALRERDQALRARDAEERANREANIAEAVNKFLLQDLLSQVDINVQFSDGFTPNPNLTVKEALDRAAARIGERFQDQPLVEAVIRRTISNGYSSLGEPGLAVSHLERAVALHNGHLGRNHPNTLDSMRSLAMAYRWSGRLPEAITLFEEIVEHQNTTLGADDVETVNSMHDLGEVCNSAGQWRRAELLLGEVVVKRQARLGRTHPDTASSMQFLAWTFAMLGRLRESLALIEETLKIYEASIGPDHPSTIGCMRICAKICEKNGKLDEAASLLRLALERERKHGDPTRQIRIANTLDLLGRNLLLQEKYAAAEPLLREALAIYQTYQPNNWRRFGIISLLGGALLGQQQYATAEALLLQGYEGMKQRDTMMHAGWKYLLPEAVERIVALYEVTDQPEKARLWREKLAVRAEVPMSPDSKKANPELVPLPRKVP